MRGGRALEPPPARTPRRSKRDSAAGAEGGSRHQSLSARTPPTVLAPASAPIPPPAPSPPRLPIDSSSRGPLDSSTRAPLSPKKQATKTAAQMRRGTHRHGTFTDLFGGAVRRISSGAHMESSSAHSGRTGRGAAAEPKRDEPAKKMGMFQGVIVPTCANMWGVLIFLRFNNIVGQAGLGEALVIAVLAYTAALLTTLSLSAIATCGASSKQGVFPMLSRALGRELATAIALMYFLGITLGAVLESLGACEVWIALDPSFGGFFWDVQLWGSVFMAGLALLVLGGMRLVSQLGMGFFVVTLCTLLAFYVSLIGAPNLASAEPEPALGATTAGASAGAEYELGLSAEHLSANLSPGYTEGQSFSTNLALFFPAFTGFLSGANRASSLANPSAGIPYGTLSGITISFVVYTAYMLLWAAVGEREFLQLARGHLEALIWPSVTAVRIGIVVTSLGQALQNLVVAPLLLQSVAQEGVLRVLNPFAVRHKGEPKRALAVAYVVGALCVLIGSLDLVAPLLSMCFLLCYASMNLTCFVLDLLQDPSWRPKWRYFHWSTGLAGFVLCVGLMFAISFIYALIAWACAGMIVLYILRHSAETDWGSALHGLRFKLAMRSLAAIDMQAHLEIAWCPQVLLMYQLQVDEEVDEADANAPGYEPADPSIWGGVGGSTADVDGRDRRAGSIGVASVGSSIAGPAAGAIGTSRGGHTHKVMISLADQLRKGQGLVIAAAIVPLLKDEGMSDPDLIEYAESEKKYMAHLFKRIGLQGFPMTVLSRDPFEGKAYAIQCAGLGPLTPNTVLMGWPWWWRSDAPTIVPAFLESIHQCTRLHKAVVIGKNLNHFPTHESLPMPGGYIDVWWIRHDGGLLLLLSNLLKKHKLWRRCHLRLHLVTDSLTEPALIRDRMHKLLTMINISASVEEVVRVSEGSMLPYMTRAADGGDAHEADDELLCAPDDNAMPEQLLLEAVHAAGATRRHSVAPPSGSATDIRAMLGARAAVAGPDGRPSVARSPSMPGADLEVGRPAGCRLSAGGTAGPARRHSLRSGRYSRSDSGRRAAADVGGGHESDDEDSEPVRPVRRRSVATAGVAANVGSRTSTAQTSTPSPRGAAQGSSLSSAAPMAAAGAIAPSLSAPLPTTASPHSARLQRHGTDDGTRAGAPGADGTDAPPPPAPPVEPPPSPGPPAPPMPPSPPRGAGGAGVRAAPDDGSAHSRPRSAQPSPPGSAGLPSRAPRDLLKFVTRNALNPQQADELCNIFESATAKSAAAAAAAAAAEEAPAAEQRAWSWEEIHEIIVQRSRQSQLVLINLPDPPEAERTESTLHSASDIEDMVHYMEYMEGLSASLPRVLFVHGAGQEVIRFDLL